MVIEGEKTGMLGNTLLAAATGACVSLFAWGEPASPGVWFFKVSALARAGSEEPTIQQAETQMTIYRVAADGSGDFSSVDEVNAANLQPGDIVQFHRGDVFRGTGIQAQDGVAYEAYGTGEKPLLTDIDGTGFTAANDSTLRDLAITYTTGRGLWADKKENLTVENVDFDYTFRSTPDTAARNVEIYHTDNVVFKNNTMDHTAAGSMLYLFNSDNAVIENNDMTMRGKLSGGTGSGDAIVVTASENFYIGHNTVDYLHGWKGGIQVLGNREGLDRGGVIEFNEVNGGQFGISPRQSNVLVQGNIIRDVGNQSFSLDWATGIWISATSDPRDGDVHNLDIVNNVIVDSPRAIGSWEPRQGLLTEYEVAHNTIINAEDNYFFRDNGEFAGSFHHNLVVDSGPRKVRVDESNWSEHDNYYFNVQGQPNTGPDPQIDGTFHATLDAAQGFGLQQTVTVGPDSTSGGDGTTDDGGGDTADGGGDGTTGDGTTDGGGGTAGEGEIAVRMAGDSGDGGDPHYRIVADGEVLAEGDVTWSRTTKEEAYADPSAWQEVAVAYAGDAAPNEVRVEFTNDAWGGSDGDRNLLVDRVTVNGMTFEAEGDGVDYERARNTDLDGQETMAWQGALVFDTSAAPAPGSTTDGGGDTADGGGDGTTGDGTTDGGGGTAGEGEIAVRMAGDSGDGGDPHYRIVADGEVLAEGDVTWSRTTKEEAYADPSAWQEVAVAYAGDAAPNEVRVEFTNDAWGGSDGDRNLLVDRVTVNGMTFEAEGDGVDYERAQNTDLDGQETMAWQGALVFDTSAAPAPGSTTDGSGGTTDSGGDGAVDGGGGEILARLAGDSGAGGDPHYRVLADGQMIGEGDVTWSRATAEEAYADPSAWQDVVLSYKGEAPSEVTVEFTNDAWGAPDGDRNLLVDYVELDGLRQEAEDPDVVYHADNQGDIAGQEVMAWNGAMDFDFAA